MKNNKNVIEKDPTTNSNLNNALLFFVLYALTLVTTFFGWNSVVGLVTDEFASLYKMLPIVISYLLPLAYIVMLFRNLFYKRFSKPGLIVFLSITTVLLVGCILLFIYELDYHINNYLVSYKNSFSPLDNVLIILVLLATNIVLLVKLCTKKFSKEYRDPINPGVFNVYTSPRMVMIGFMLVLAGFAFAFGIFGITNFDYFVRFPLPYTSLILALLMPLIGFIFYLFVNPKKKHTLVTYSVVTLVNIIVLGAYAYLQYTSDALIYVTIGQNLFRISFSSRLPIYQVLLIILLILNLASLIVSFAKYKKQNKHD